MKWRVGVCMTRQCPIRTVADGMRAELERAGLSGRSFEIGFIFKIGARVFVGGGALVSDRDEVVAEAFCDLVGVSGDDGGDVDAHEHRLVGLDCDESVGL